MFWGEVPQKLKQNVTLRYCANFNASWWSVSLTYDSVLTFRMEQFMCRRESGGWLKTEGALWPPVPAYNRHWRRFGVHELRYHFVRHSITPFWEHGVNVEWDLCARSHFVSIGANRQIVWKCKNWKWTAFIRRIERWHKNTSKCTKKRTKKTAKKSTAFRTSLYYFDALKQTVL